MNDQKQDKKKTIKKDEKSRIFWVVGGENATLLFSPCLIKVINIRNPKGVSGGRVVAGAAAK